MRHSVLLAALLLANAATAQSIDPKVQARIDRILKKTPLIDGHNDIAEALQENYNFSVANLASGTDKWPEHPLMTDMARLHAGRVGGQFWSVYINGELKGDEAIRRTIEQIDIVDRMIAAYPNDLERALTADDDRAGGQPVLVLSDKGWQRHFNRDPDVIGRTVIVTGAPYEIVGVMPEGFRGLEVTAPDAWAPLARTFTSISSRSI